MDNHITCLCRKHSQRKEHGACCFITFLFHLCFSEGFTFLVVYFFKSLNHNFPLSFSFYMHIPILLHLFTCSWILCTAAPKLFTSDHSAFSVLFCSVHLDFFPVSCGRLYPCTGVHVFACLSVRHECMEA